MDVRENILEKATELYTRFGIRAVTMDDIAKELGISKKTIYQYYKDKSELVSTITKYHFDIESQRFCGLTEESKNGVHELVLLSTCLRDSIRETKMNLLHELQKFYPKAWKMYEEFKGNVMKESIVNVIERGKREGLFRPSIDAELIAIMRIEQVQTFLLGNLVPRDKYTIEEIQMQLFDHFMHGLFTIEGHQLFNQYTTNSKKMKSRINKYTLMLALLLPAIAVKAQTEYSLNKALEYALINNENVKNAQLSTLDAEAQVFETRADGLPQITAGFNYTNNLFIAKSPIPNSFITGDPNAEGVTLVGFGAQHVGNLNVGLEQMLWDGSFFIGLQAAKVLREKVIIDKAKAEVDVIEQVTKAYYLVLVNQTRVDLINANLLTLNTTLDETRTLYENGFAERIDVSRLQVQTNNLLAERSGVEQSVKASKDLLKLSMGMPVTEEITLTGELEALDFKYDLSELEGFALSNRLEVQQLNFLKELAGLQIKNTTSQYIPKVTFNAGWGRNTGSNDFSDLTNGKKWFSNSQIGLNVSIPIFDGLRKKYTIQRNKIELETLNNQYSLLTNSLSQEFENAKRNLEVSLEQLEVQESNMELAQEVSSITKEKYKEGVGSNLEVTNAEKDYKEAETNYLNALYNAIISKVDLDKALGKLRNNDN